RHSANPIWHARNEGTNITALFAVMVVAFLAGAAVIGFWLAPRWLGETSLQHGATGALLVAWLSLLLAVLTTANTWRIARGRPPAKLQIPEGLNHCLVAAAAVSFGLLIGTTVFR